MPWSQSAVRGLQKLLEGKLYYFGVFRAGRYISEFLDNIFILQMNKQRLRYALHKAERLVHGRSRTRAPVSSTVQCCSWGHPVPPTMPSIDVGQCFGDLCPVITNRSALQLMQCAAEKTCGLWSLWVQILALLLNDDLTAFLFWLHGLLVPTLQDYSEKKK